MKEITLWKAVLKQAFIDAQRPLPASRKFKTEAMATHNARVWLQGNSKDFNMVCDLANECPIKTRRIAREMLWNDCLR